MTLQEAIETLREFRKLNLGPELSLAIDTACDAVDALVESDRMYRGRIHGVPVGVGGVLTTTAAQC